ncbi:TorF family putative porin [Acinetobacter zhairhuonensis]|uniref:TorF family putative porin n=1 Tax=Acinetobacter sp. A7.4 TaxID=2919921 RepID=UPI001F4D41EB|nr:TorF family putative porin [Acinetobacter sp. A7.4]MCJ8160008.1 TorF family putative porin [Acinetobacter sp. A7.4]
MMKNKLVYGLLAALAVSQAQAETAAEPSFLNSFSSSGSVALLTDYYSRGYSQNQGNPAVQGFLRLDHTSGFYAQLFASNIDLDIGSSLELDYYLGYDYLVNDHFKLNVQYLDVNYPGADKTIPSPDYEEYSVSAIGMGLLKEEDELNFSFYYSPEYSFQTGKELRYELSYFYPVAESWSAYAQVGYNQFSSKDAYAVLWATDKKESYTDYKIGGNYSYNDFIFDLYYVDSNMNKDLSNADDAVIFSITKEF